ncbi:MAG: DUF3192 domain-containing protein [Victivallaceae bacterium]|nr:DUF3192 domain-containing protein [Victivallaceae bacterium]MDD4180867.1 DUF3192 domain-containing protein [Victivallaceae bacterium]
MNWKFFSMLLGFLLLAASLTASLTGCSSFGYYQARENLKKSADLRVGMTKNEVLHVMGEPVQNQEYSRPDVWFYYINPLWYDALITQDECMPLVFEDGKLTGWGNEYYNQYYYASPRHK